MNTVCIIPAEDGEVHIVGGPLQAASEVRFVKHDINCQARRTTHEEIDDRRTCVDSAYMFPLKE